MTILDALKYRLSKKGVNSEADNIAEAVKEMADNDNGGMTCLVVDSTEDDYKWEWNQNHSFDEIYNAAVGGRLILHCRIKNSTDEYHDMIIPMLPTFIANEKHSGGRSVRFVDHDNMFINVVWNNDGFHRYNNNDEAL